MLKKYSKYILLLIFVLALLVRWWYLPKNALTFAYDQARDAFVAREILAGDLKILGPSVSGVPGFYHGVLYYYVIAPAYLLGGGNPIFAAYWMSFINALVVFVVFYLTARMFGKLLPAAIAALLFAASYEASQYATWLSNPAMGVWFVTLIYLGLYLWLKEKKIGYLSLVGLAFGLSIQSNVSLAYHAVPIGLWLWYSRKDIGKKQLLAILLPFLIAISSMLAVEARFGFKSIEGVKLLLVQQESGEVKIRLGDYLVAYVNHMGNIFAHNLFPFISALGGLMGLGILGKCILKLKNKGFVWVLEIKFLLSWILSFLIPAAISGAKVPHIGAGIGVGFIILTAFFIWEVFQKNKALGTIILIFILVANFSKVVSEGSKGQTIFAIQKDLTLAKELAAVDKTYQEAQQKPFSINTLTSPLYINTTWSYLYNWYGSNKFGYLPYWRGRDQIGSLGDNLKPVPPGIDKHFFIMEPLEGIPALFVGYAIGEEDARGKAVGRANFGEIIVESRQITHE
ncbi:hypothetical protein A2V56_00065 [Candidatus Woesebacteria bacterium RBG_19FT_COMBO_42_9]|uniref:Glycosyltransferase RgtA/B/C/D-like domain-containing protein n=1 Tax=Candidatus Woesebacteria bacterium RBG_16_42_24 TaxID=1802485 RepID=A0A1F7XKF0_9BACT|nr:MAG: hypothetical protein A2V97_02520 [Candidatus Woesebacteria bacterium RBG_16_42_24]OGM16631.1 MAG: hypothetical protein A2V56_00065 [Candidatus Woesebacteria bacterium RBG_19FT_COMBO_42_9]OGM68184.1 MAG: hypothetical protein A2985_04150 [Candidatus Woesebacteria bacterium RIFCSPLOWO2_01_FULL_43_11]